MTKAREAIARRLPPIGDGTGGPGKPDLDWAGLVITALREAGLRIVPEKMTLEMARACMEAMRDKDTVDLKAIWDAAISAYEDGK